MNYGENLNTNNPNVAAACREMGIQVGDTILGRDADASGQSWHEARLTLMWLGECVAVWREQTRCNWRPEWTAPEESANWTLEFRTWQKVAGAQAGL